ncbi:MAG: alpha/beta hydrolase [Alphaproteobacteria bacterium]|nr:alpha/beta hydrolase [Alphaproteobacteria bacterium]
MSHPSDDLPVVHGAVSDLGATRPRFRRSLAVAGLWTAACAGILLLSSCARYPVMEDDTVKRTAMPVFMLERKVPTELFLLEARERVYDRHAPATVYIEGDGVPYIDEKHVSDDPTPADPVALRLAAQDGDSNVIWLARPCQYFKEWRGYSAGDKTGGQANDKAGKKACPKAYWTDRKFAPEVIESYNMALDNIKAYYGIPVFNLVGYDGGAVIAMALAAQRQDIKSLRTVAGNLAPDVTAQIHNYQFNGQNSVNPRDYADRLETMPQRHFIGRLDRVTPPVVYNSYAQNVQDGKCLNATLVDNADHQLGWVEQWKTLKTLPTDCQAPAVPVKFDPTPLDGDKYKPAKKHK